MEVTNTYLKKRLSQMRRIYFFQTILVFLDNYQVIQFKNISNKMKFNGTHADWYEISYRLVETRANCVNTLSCYGVRFLRNFHLNLFHLSILLAHIRVLVCCVGRKQAITFEFIVRELFNCYFTLQRAFDQFTTT